MHKTSWRHWALQMSFGGLLSLSSCWLITSTIAPTPVQAYVSRSSVELNVQAGESYAAFLSRAEAVARAAVQRNFDRDVLISEAYIVVVGQRQGQTAPVLSVRVSRTQWRARPDSRRWATYLPSAKTLLGFGIPSTPPTGRTPTAASPTPTTTINPPATTPPAPTRDRSTEPEQSPLEQLLPQPEPTPTTTAPTQTPNSTPLPPGGSTR